MNEDDRKLAALVAACCIAGALLVILATVVFLPARAHAQTQTFDAMWIDIEGERHLLLAPSGQEKLGALFKSQSDEIDMLNVQLARARKGCPRT